MTIVHPSVPIPPVSGSPARRAARHRLSALVASRICHDLVSPLGAIANGLELMALTAPPSPEGDLIAESAAAANARLRFFRLAYGPATPDQTTSRAEVTATLKAISRGGRTSYDWEPAGDHPRHEVRMVLLLLQCFETAMPMGGHVRVIHDAHGWVVSGEGPSMRVDETLWLSIRPGRGSPPEAPSLVHFSLLAEILFETGRLPTLKLSSREIVVRL